MDVLKLLAVPLLALAVTIRCDSCGHRWIGMHARGYVCPACGCRLDAGAVFRGVEFAVEVAR